MLPNKAPIMVIRTASGEQWKTPTMSNKAGVFKSCQNNVNLDGYGHELLNMLITNEMAAKEDGSVPYPVLASSIKIVGTKMIAKLGTLKRTIDLQFPERKLTATNLNLLGVAIAQMPPDAEACVNRRCSMSYSSGGSASGGDTSLRITPPRRAASPIKFMNSMALEAQIEARAILAQKGEYSPDPKLVTYLAKIIIDGGKLPEEYAP